MEVNLYNTNKKYNVIYADPPRCAKDGNMTIEYRD